eukprot:snap_masked-scaffold_15-processed-gene-5.21-mRNA-1 protein AED:1.00 eAED:1.00 QI:0/-1/0/0/-1/1/1/0/83
MYKALKRGLDESFSEFYHIVLGNTGKNLNLQQVVGSRTIGSGVKTLLARYLVLKYNYSMLLIELPPGLIVTVFLCSLYTVWFG